MWHSNHHMWFTTLSVLGNALHVIDALLSLRNPQVFSPSIRVRKIETGAIRALKGERQSKKIDNLRKAGDAKEFHEEIPKKFSNTFFKSIPD